MAEPGLQEEFMEQEKQRVEKVLLEEDIAEYGRKIYEKI